MPKNTTTKSEQIPFMIGDDSEIQPLEIKSKWTRLEPAHALNTVSRTRLDHVAKRINNLPFEPTEVRPAAHAKSALSRTLSDCVAADLGQ